MNIPNSVFIHPTAIVDLGAKIGENSKVWHWVHICSKAVIGDNCIFGQNVYIGNSVKVGNNVKVQNNVSIYDQVTLEDDVFCGPSMVFTNVYNPRSKIERKSEYKKTLVKKGTTIGANATIICGLEIGEFAFIGAGALVNKNVKPYALMVGVPAIHIGWMSRYGERIKLPIKGIGKWECPKTGEIYELKNDEFLKCTYNDNI